MPSTTLLSPSGRQQAYAALTDYPRPDRAAAEAVQAWAQGQGVSLDPDHAEVVTLHYQQHEGQWYAQVISHASLPQALLANWQGESANNLLGGLFGEPWAGTAPPEAPILVDELPYQHNPLAPENGASYAVYNGLYQRTTPASYGPANQLPLSAEAFQAFVWQLDFSSAYRAMLDRYWAARQDAYGFAAKLGLVAACNKQVAEGSLSARGQHLVWQVAGLKPIPSWEALGKAPKAYPPALASALNIYGYAASDLLCLYDSESQLALLYIPGNASPLHEFSSPKALRAWVAEQCKQADTRQALKAHFNLADAPDGLDFSGLDSALAGLADYPHPHHLPPQRPGFTTEGVWDPQVYVNYRPKTYSPLLSGDLGQALATRQQQRSYADAEFLITTRSDVTKAHWRSYVNSALNLLGPLALVVPELAPLFAVGGAAQFGLGLDAAIHGKDAEAQAEGVQGAVFGVLNALPLVHAAGEKAGELFGAESGFFAPRRVNGQLGYPLSPIDAPHWPQDPFAQAFGPVDTLTAVAGHDQAVARCVTRLGRWTGEQDVLEATIEDRITHVAYDLKRDVFVRVEDLNAVDPIGYVAPPDALYQLEPEGATAHPASDESRMATLRALGVDLTLPVDLAGPLLAERSAIPRSVMSLWVGDKLINPTLLSTIGRNAEAFSAAEFRFRLFLSNTHPEAFAQNLQLLAEHAPTLEVVTLEEQPFYARFSESENAAQYRAALGEGGGPSNYASASDVLRYPLLHEEGGIYMDLDDSVLPAGSPSRSFGRPVLALQALELNTTADGLLLNDAVSNYKLGMREQYNTSIIGSHAGNPTLKAISEEMRQRFDANPAFYQQRPHPAVDPEGFLTYTRELNRLTGPGLFNDIIARLRPELYQLRQVLSLWAFALIDSAEIIPLSDLPTSIDAHLPFTRAMAIGGTESWAST
ncbi:dermonecrotic toxin domain-containing protein [Pseudomonas sp. NPDC007930]|uniref:dermonecrotic toxin domain-containing protein n=1 Tax=Pseudomonas sp. NPDC007930 TaxID=3364417 RepID=UPI0036F08316